jgi:hypothetical protein
MATPTVISGTTTSQNVFNELDEFGLLLGQPRLTGERNAQYKQRLARVFSERANSTYRGLIHGITRNLGLNLFNALTITALETGGSFTAPNPAIIFNEAFVYLYSDFENEILDRTIDRFDPAGTAFYLTDLIDRINESTYFSASLNSGIDPYTRSMTILNQASHITITNESVPSTRRFELENTNIVKGTIFFSDRVIFKTLVASESEVNAPGKYFVNHKIGLIISYDPAIADTSVRYEYLKNPIITKASPVIIHNMQSLDFKVKLFEQVLADDGTYINGLPTSLGANLINELLSVYPVYWGE